MVISFAEVRKTREEQVVKEEWEKVKKVLI